MKRNAEAIKKCLGFAGLVAVMLCIHTPRAEAFELSLPVDCTLGKDCFIQNYVDQGKGKAHQDFRCRPLSYDGHKGTDFRIPVMRPADQNTRVIASADGVVKNVRDGVPDAVLGEKGKPSTTNVECGNGIVIDHEGGWQTQYCHLRQGSVKVKAGQSVKVGDVLGEIGLSGQTEFPHVHLSVRNPKGEAIDPFNAHVMETGCTPSKKQLWSTNALSKISVEDSGFLSGGVAPRPVKVTEIINGDFQTRTLPSNAPAIVFWTLSYGLQKGDQLTLLLFDPKGETFVENTTTIDGFKAQYLQFIGKKNSKSLPWAKGTYEGIITVKRGKDTVINQSIPFKVQ
jgi:murein DD-endopeptidase MepM/ murein hydrolase activator NlpD